MNQPREDAIAAALAALSVVTSVGELAAGATQLIDGMGMERYSVLDVRRSLVVSHIHNAPDALAAEVSGLQGVTDDAIAARARASHLPFVWECPDDSWRARGAEIGYRSGVAAGSFDPSGVGCIVVLSWSGEAIPAEHSTTLLTYSLMASMQLRGPLQRITLVPVSECPLTERELDCLVYVMAGKSMKDTARDLGIGPRTVEEYLGRARVKLGASNSYAAATTALRKGWLDLQRASELANLGAAPGARHVG